MYAGNRVFPNLSFGFYMLVILSFLFFGTLLFCEDFELVLNQNLNEVLTFTGFVVPRLNLTRSVNHIE
jgi:hypothetical protein